MEDLISVAQALCARSDQNLMVARALAGEGGELAVPTTRLAHMEMRLDVSNKGIRGRGAKGGKLAVGAKLEAYSPQLLREHRIAGCPETVRRAPVILVEIKDGFLEQAVTRFFNTYADLYASEAPGYERPSLLIFIDLSSESMPARMQLQLVAKIEDRLQQVEAHGLPAHKEAASRVFFNDPYACIQGLSLAASNDLVLSTIRRSTVCGLNFLRCLTGRDVLKMHRYKTGDAGDVEPDGAQTGEGVDRLREVVQSPNRRSGKIKESRV